MREMLVGYHENLKGDVYQKIPSLCQKIFKIQGLRMVEAFAFGGSLAQGKWQAGQDIDADICLTRLPPNGKQQQICIEMVDIFSQAGFNLDIRFITDRKGNHGIFIEHKPASTANPLELSNDFTPEDLKKLYQKQYSQSVFVAKNEKAAKFWFGVTI